MKHYSDATALEMLATHLRNKWPRDGWRRGRSWEQLACRWLRRVTTGKWVVDDDVVSRAYPGVLILRLLTGDYWLSPGIDMESGYVFSGMDPATGESWSRTLRVEQGAWSAA
jgi:hypothetical protein